MARARTCPPAPTGRRQPVATRWFPRTRSIHSITLLQFRVWARRSAGSDPPLTPDAASRLHRGLVALATAFVLLPQEAPAHDPDTLGGSSVLMTPAPRGRPSTRASSASARSRWR